MPAHADHAAKHGGIFFMSSNGFNHVEGTYPEAGLFRMYLYDDHTQPIDAQGFTGAIHLDGAPDADRLPLTYEPATRTLDARIDPAPPLPLALELFVMLKDPKTGVPAEQLFDFTFTRIGGEPVAEHAHAHAPGDHEHATPHGGRVVSVGTDYHFELVDSGSMLTLWVLDANLAELPVDDMEASLLVQPKGAPAITLPLMPMQVHFMASSPLKNGEPAVVIATVKIKGAAQSARFSLGAGN